MVIDREWLFGTIRKIPDMPFGVEAAVALDTDDTHALCIASSVEGQFGVHFNIEWLESDEQKVNWLAWVVGRAMQESYNSGGHRVKREVKKHLVGLKALLDL